MAASGKKAIVFAGSVLHATAIDAALTTAGISSGLITSRTPPSQRRQLIKAYRNGEVKILVNKSILLTGFDAPGTDAVFLLVPLLSSIQFEQAVGRAARGRAVGGVTNASVYQFDDHLAIHGLPQSFYRFRAEDWQ
jgi:superfamily II DNA or RNA helicase